MRLALIALEGVRRKALEQKITVEDLPVSQRNQTRVVLEVGSRPFNVTCLQRNILRTARGANLDGSLLVGGRAIEPYLLKFSSRQAKASAIDHRPPEA